MSPAERRKAVAHLRRVDPKLAAVIARVGPCRFQARAEGTHLDALFRAIIYQQLSGKAAATIHARFLAIYGHRPPTPPELLGTSDERLRGVGLSRQKLGYMRDLATRISTGEVRIDALHALPDEEVLTELVRVKGIGRWTAHMFLIFRLGRLNVLPDLDLGVQKGVMRAYGMRRMPTPKAVQAIGSKWAPYASVATWYLWRSLDPAAPEHRRPRRSGGALQRPAVPPAAAKKRRRPRSPRGD
ncbi:MAG: DNA-3-methyladenine glycosylase [Gemmatimonadaceae bacterium]